MELFDTHLHLSPERDNHEMIRKAQELGVRFQLVCASSLAAALAIRDIVRVHPDVFFAAGVHPHEAEGYVNDPAAFDRLAADPRFRAVGEIGIDTFYSISPLEKQTAALNDMLEFALRCKAPAIIHCRAAEGSDDAYQTCFDALSAFAARGGRFVVHCFAGTVEWMRKFAELGAYFGVGGMLTFKRSDNIREVVMRMPEDRILLETDSPYLAPVPFRGRPNFPEYLPLVAHKLAELKGVPAEQVAERTTRNAFALFGEPERR